MCLHALWQPGNDQVSSIKELRVRMITPWLNQQWIDDDIELRKKKQKLKGVISKLIFNRVCFDSNSKITVFFDLSYEKDTSELKDNIYRVFQLSLLWVETYLWQQAFPWTQRQPWLKGKERDCTEEIKGKTGTGRKVLDRCACVSHWLLS